MTPKVPSTLPREAADFHPAQIPGRREANRDSTMEVEGRERGVSDGMPPPSPSDGRDGEQPESVLGENNGDGGSSSSDGNSGSAQVNI